VLRVPGTDRAAASLVSFSDDQGIYLYNSSYDPHLAEASPGIAIVGTLIEQAIAEGLPRFDFLKGAETYKFRLGAEARPLYRITSRAVA
jgi:CelD/BcsL family acetyltransferase involved in cellulose biosynthesis